MVRARKTTITGGIISIILLTLAFACSNVEKEASFFMRVGNKTVTFDEFNRSFGSYISDLKKEYINDYIDNLVLETKAEELGIEVTENDVEKYIGFFEENLIETSLDKYLKSSGMTKQKWREKIKKDLAREKVIKSQIYDKIAVNDYEIGSYYEENHEEFILPKKYHVYQILVGSEDEAMSISGKLKSSKNFKDYAVKYSIAPEASKGGDLGFIAITELPKEAHDELLCLQKGQISNIVESEMGYHLFMISEIQPSKLASIEDVKEKITKVLKEKKQEETLRNWLTELRKNIKIEVKSKDF